MSEDPDIYEGDSIDGSMESKSKNTWVQVFDMIDLAFNNLQQQNKELKRTMNEMSSKINKVRIICYDKMYTNISRPPLFNIYFLISGSISCWKRRKQT